MKIIKKTILVTAITTLGLTAYATDKKTVKPTSIQQGQYKIDPSHTKVGFEIPHLVISSVEGRFTTFDGELDLKEKFSESKVTATINIDSIDTANADRDNHLKSADFFDSGKYPKMTFKSKKIIGTSEKFKLIGDLTIKDKTKEVTFQGQFQGTVKDAYGNTKAAFQASTEINRQDFGLTWNKLVEAGPAVGNEVKITLKVQATKTNESKINQQN